MDLKKLIVLVVVAFVLFYLISAPSEAANAVHAVLNALKTGADALITFVKTLFA